ncbi:ABC transporter ATP-binding protein [Thermococcus sp.]|uniref:ATP-binding cassette domain-containing protein n=1 Tax=Thermococcus sp. TaxID=35749 RepID=UPI00260996B6|nr:ABC transporter ATP-binding protein [Thermococcus sp.]
MIVEAEDLGVDYGKTWGIKNLTFKAKADRLAIIGHNGSGKTTLLSVLAGIRHPTRGSARINGWEPYKRKDKWVAIRYSFEKPQFRIPVRVRDVVETLRANQMCLKIDELVEVLGITPFLDKRIDSLSSGQAQLCNLLVALSCDSEVVILDEPTAHLDSYRAGIVDELISKRKGVIIATHDVEEGEAVADYFLILKEGRLVWHGGRRELFSSDVYEVTLIETGTQLPFETIYRFGATLIVRATSHELVEMVIKGVIAGFKRAGLRYVYAKSS